MSDLPEEGGLKDLMSRHWTKLENAPSGMMYGAAVVAWDENRAIITGGFEDGIAKDTVFVYNKNTTDTEVLTSMRQGRSGHASVIVGSNLFVIGGNGQNGITLNSIEVLDLNGPREWQQFPVSLEIARFGCSAVAVNEHEIFIIGGYGRRHQILDSVEILNTATKTISQGPPMIEGRVGFAAALIGDAIAVVGGYTRTGLDYTSTSEQLSVRASSFEDDARRWQPLNSMTAARAHHYGLNFGDCMVVVGGFNRGALQLTTIEVWSGTTGTWTQLPAELPDGGFVKGFVKLGEDLVGFIGADDPSVYCLFSASGLLEHHRRQIRFSELIADERTEIVIPLLLEGLGQRGWTSLFYECIRETNGRLIPRRIKRSALGKRSRGIAAGHVE